MTVAKAAWDNAETSEEVMPASRPSRVYLSLAGNKLSNF